MFDPSELTVKQARARLGELDISGLEEVLQAEIDGKHRSSLMAEIGQAIDAVKTAEESEAVAEEAPQVVTVEEAPKQVISAIEWFRFPRNVRKGWERLVDGTYRKR
jgi:hypothetical protein